MIYLDNHATTCCDPRVIDAMLPWLTDNFGNPSSTSHEPGRVALDAVTRATASISMAIDAPLDSIVYTSGATESNNLAIKGVLRHPRNKKRHFITVSTEHHAVLDIADELEREGFRVTRVPALPNGNASAGIIDLDRLAESIDDDTALVSVMWANNEVGSITPMKQVAEICHSKGALLHSDATQAVGRIPIDVCQEDVDLVSASAHKFYGPKGIGFLVVGNGHRRVRLKPELVGGGQQAGLRSGTLNPAGIMAMATALQIYGENAAEEDVRTKELRDELFMRLNSQIEGLKLNGPPLTEGRRLPGNLNLQLPSIEGESWMAATPTVAFSSGSACSSSSPEPSHVLTAMGLTESQARQSVRFGIGRFNTPEEIEDASCLLVKAYRHLVG